MNIVVGDAAQNTAQPRGDAHATASARRVLVVFNPAAGRQRRPRLNAIVAAARAAGCIVTETETTAPGHAEAIARDVSPGDFDVIAAAGGDGTVNEVINGLQDKAIAIGVIPLGTANVLADEISLARTPQAIAHALARGPIRPVHVGEANGRRFMMMAGAGFDADVVSGVSLDLKKRIGPLAYVWQAAVQAFKKSPPVCEITIDGTAYRSASAVVCNGKRYGGPFIAAPRASLADDCFHVVLMPGGGWLDIARYGVALLLGRIGDLGDVTLVPGREIVVRGLNGRPVQADGDIIAALPVHIRIVPEPVRLVFPA